MPTVQPTCLYCNRDSHAVPLIAIYYRLETHWICPQHLPILIHQPERLAEFLPGMDRITPPEHHAQHHP